MCFLYGRNRIFIYYLYRLHASKGWWALLVSVGDSKSLFWIYVVIQLWMCIFYIYIMCLFRIWHLFLYFKIINFPILLYGNAWWLAKLLKFKIQIIFNKFLKRNLVLYRTLCNHDMLHTIISTYLELWPVFWDHPHSCFENTALLRQPLAIIRRNFE
jgi:hypothetical protein